MKPDGLVEVQWEQAQFRVCNPAGGKCEQSSQYKYCTVDSTILGGLAASVGRSMTARFEVSLMHENTMPSETMSNLKRTQNQRSFEREMIGCVCGRLSSDINAFVPKKKQQNIIGLFGA